MKPILLAAALSSVAAIPSTLLRRTERHHASRRAAIASTWGGSVLPPDQFFNQTLDHFDAVTAVDPSTFWAQRFWVNATFFNGSGPVFLYVEGEGAGSAADVVGGQHVELAAAHGSLIVALEHRFFGASIPTADLTTASLRHLSSPQAIGDTARFITEYLIPTFDLDLSMNKIVTFGGSYPGALSAFLRQKLPHLIHSAFASSAPVLAVADFTGYNNDVGVALTNPNIGGSAQCLTAVTAAFAEIDAALSGSAADRAAISSAVFSCAPIVTDLDALNLAGNTAGAIMGVVQYNNDGPGAYNVQQLCATMLQPNTKPLAALKQVISATTDGACVDNLYADFIAQIRNTTVDKTVTGVGGRQWQWLTISAYGFYQTCDQGTGCPFTPTWMPLSFSYQQGMDGFGAAFTADFTEDRIAFTNSYFGGRDSATSRILYTNGGVDPWHMLSVTPANGQNGGEATVWIPNGAHCRNMFPSIPSFDPPEVVKARLQSAAILEGWLQQPYYPAL